VILYIYRVARS